MTPGERRLFGAKAPNVPGFVALLNREVRRYAKEAPETVAAPAVSSLIYVLVFLVALGPELDSPEGEAVVSFLLPGLVMLAAIYRAAETTAFSVLFQKMERIITDILMAPLGPTEIAGAFALAGMVSGLLTGGVTFIALLPFAPEWPPAPLLALGYAAGGSLMLALAGLLMGLASEKWDHLAAWLVFGLFPLLFLSGVFAPVDRLPDALALAIRFNPIHHAIDGFRVAVTGRPGEPLWLSGAVVANSCGLLWAISLSVLARGWRLRS